MSTFWSFTKTVLALGSIAILAAPALRRLGFLPPEQDSSAAALTGGDGPGEARGAPQPFVGVSEAGNGLDPFAAPRH